MHVLKDILLQCELIFTDVAAVLVTAASSLKIWDTLYQVEFPLLQLLVQRTFPLVSIENFS